MPSPDATAKAALNGHAAVAWFIWLDLAGADGPLRVTTYGSDVTFAGTGDADLDGETFNAFGGELLDVGDVANSDTGSETLEITLSGIISMDTTLMNDIGDKTLWQGRTCRIWFQLYDADGRVKQGAIIPHYTGYMSSVSMTASPASDDDTPATNTMTLSVENYLSFTTQASNRSYLNQKDYDAADNSAAATIACSNGLRRDTGAHGGGGGAINVGAGGGSAGGFIGNSSFGGGAYGSATGDGWAPPYVASR